jgi:hypothetical protein
MRRPRRNSPRVAAPKERKRPLSSLVDVGNDTATLQSDPPAHASHQPQLDPPSQTGPHGGRYEPDLAEGYRANAAQHDEIYADFQRLITGR